jgi:hypothetical protein
MKRTRCSPKQEQLKAELESIESQILDIQHNTDLDDQSKKMLLEELFERRQALNEKLVNLQRNQDRQRRFRERTRGGGGGSSSHSTVTRRPRKQRRSSTATNSEVSSVVEPSTAVQSENNSSDDADDESEQDEPLPKMPEFASIEPMPLPTPIFIPPSLPPVSASSSTTASSSFNVSFTTSSTTKTTMATSLISSVSTTTTTKALSPAKTSLRRLAGLLVGLVSGEEELLSRFITCHSDLFKENESALFKLVLLRRIYLQQTSFMEQDSARKLLTSQVIESVPDLTND